MGDHGPLLLVLELEPGVWGEGAQRESRELEGARGGRSKREWEGTSGAL